MIKIRMTSREDGSYTFISFDEAVRRILDYYEVDASSYLIKGEEVQTSYFYYQIEEVSRG